MLSNRKIRFVSNVWRRGWTMTFSIVACMAVPFTATAQGQPTAVSVIDGMATATTMIVTALHMMTWVVFYFLNFLLDPQFIFDIRENGNQPFMTMLNQIWQFSRDMVNIVFAFALIGIAIVTIVMSKKEYITEHWRNIVLAIILVNFSWFFPRLVLDVANIASATVYSLPTMMASDNSCKTVMLNSYDVNHCAAIDGSNLFECDCFYVKDIRMFVNPTEYPNDQGWDCPLGGALCYQRAVLDFNSVAPHAAVLNGLVINHGRLQALASVPPRPPGALPNPGGASDMERIMLFALRELLMIAFHVFLFFPLAALFVAFLVRIPFLWITIAFMPFYFLGWVIPEKITGGYTGKILEYFLKAAFLPAIVGIPLSVGFIMVNAGMRLSDHGMNAVVNNIFGGAQMHLLPGVTTPWHILWILISMGVIWMGVFTVLKNMGQLGMGAAAIEGFGRMLGGIAIRLPASVPFIPGLGSGGKTGTLIQAGDVVRGVRAGIGRKSWDELLQPGSQIGGMDRAAETLADRSDPKTTDALNALSSKLIEVTNAVKTGGMTRDRAAHEINTVSNAHSMGLTVTPHNLVNDLRELFTGLNRHGRTDDVVQNLSTNIGELAGALSPPNPNPPTP